MGFKSIASNWTCPASSCSAKRCGTKSSEFRNSAIQLKTDNGDANMLHDFQLCSESQLDFKSSQVCGEASLFIFEACCFSTYFALDLCLISIKVSR